MSTYKKKADFLDTEEGTQTLVALKEMASNPAFHTVNSYSANSSLHPDNSVTFVEKHMTYLSAHPKTDPEHYVANLRLMTRLR